MTDTSIEVLVVGGDHRLGGADWDEKLLEHLVDQTIAQCGDDSLRDDEPMLQDLRIMAEDMKKALSSVETKTQIVRYTGSPAKITVTRAQFEEMTADLLDETIRITKRTLAEAEEKYPGIQQRISEVLLVGGSSRMPAVSAALRKEFGWDPKLADPDLAVAKGAALYAAGQTVRYVEADQGRWAAGAGDWPGGQARQRSTARARSRDRGGRTGGGRTDGPGRGQRPETRPADRRQRAAEGHRGQARGHDQAGLGGRRRVGLLRTSISSTPRRSFPSSGSPSSRARLVTNQSEIEIEIWEQAGASPGREMAANHPLDDQRPDQGPRVVLAARRITHQHGDQRRRRGDRPPQSGGAREQP